MSGFTDRIDARMAEENARFQESQIDWDEGKYTEDTGASIDLKENADSVRYFRRLWADFYGRKPIGRNVFLSFDIYLVE